MRLGSEQALTELYHRYYKSLFLKAFKRVSSTPLVEEIVQDVFLNLWMKAASLDPEGNVRAYLYATLRNKVLFELRTEQTRAYYLHRAQAVFRDETPDNTQTLYAREIESRIQGIISTLPPKCREAFLFSRYQDLSHKEIAERMHLSVSTVEKHITKALRILRSKLNEYDVMIWVLVMVYTWRH